MARQPDGDPRVSGQDILKGKGPMTHPRLSLVHGLMAFLCGFAVAAAASDNDWPTWRHDANRSAASPIELPEQLHLQWQRESCPPHPAFGEDIRLCFDMSYEPVVMGKTMFLPSMVTDNITALDTESGAEKWTFHADGPVRLAPVAWQSKVYFVSDDGCLYCVDANEGKLIWRFSGIPAGYESHKLLGDERLISRWPARGGPVLVDGTVYFATGVWPFEGVFVHAVNAETGGAVWVNKECADIKDGLIDHGTRRNGGLSPQGYLAVAGEKLIVPSGRSLPGFFDRETGQMEPYTSGWGGRDALAKGSWYACAFGGYLFQSGDVYALTPEAASVAGTYESKDLWTFEDFAKHAGVPLETVRGWTEKDLLETVEQDGKRFIRVAERPNTTYVSWVMGAGLPGEQHAVSTRPRLQVDPANDKALGLFREPVLTENTIYYSEPSDDQQATRNRWPADLSYREIVACDITKATWGVSCESGWGEPERLVVWKNLRFDERWRLPSKHKVFIKAGPRLYAGSPGAVAAIDIPGDGGKPKGSWETEIQGAPCGMLAADGKLFVVTKEGTIYCFGGREVQPRTYAAKAPGDPPSTDKWTRTAADILKQTGAAEGYCLALGIGTGRLIEELARQSKLHIVALDPDAEKVDATRRRLDAMGLYGARIHALCGDLMSMQLAPYVASLTVSEDLRGSGFERGKEFAEKLFHVTRPYGGVACLPVPQGEHEAFADWVKEARLPAAKVSRVGELTLLARPGALPGADDCTHEGGSPGNTFTSRDQRVKPPFGVLWFGGAADWVGLQPPAAIVSSGRMFILDRAVLHAIDIYTGRLLWQAALQGSRPPIAAAEDSVYVMCGDACLRIDPASGSKIGEIPLPKQGKKQGSWTEVRIWGDCLIGTSGSRLYGMDRHSGTAIWEFQGRQDRLGFAVGNGKVFAVEYWSSAQQRRGMDKPDESTISSLDLSDGKVLWQTTARMPETHEKEKAKNQPRPLMPQLAYCEATDILLFTAIKSAVAAYRGNSREALWTKEIPCWGTGVGGYKAPILLPDMLIPHAGTIYDPQTGLPLPKQRWEGMNVKARGCGRALANMHIVTFRDSFASYFDLATGRHTFFRGIRAGCTNNLIPAGGILNAPNFAQHCTCNFPIYVSFALVHMPEAAAWDPQPAHVGR